MLDDKFFQRLKDVIVGTCSICHGSGFSEKRVCECMIEFRARHRLLLGNFAGHLLELDSQSFIQNLGLGDSRLFVEYYLSNPESVREDGLSLYIWSEKRGVGKTTLAHLLAKEFAKYFSREENYSRSNCYRFMEVGEFFDLGRNRHRDETFLYDWDSTLFVLDDFGNEDNSSKWDFEFIVKLIQDFLRHRTRLRLPTIITTNTNPVNIFRKYKDDVSSLLEVQPNYKIGGLLWREVPMSGRDFRLEKELSPWRKAE